MGTLRREARRERARMQEQMLLRRKPLSDGAVYAAASKADRDPGDEQHDEFDAAFLLQDYATAKAR